MPNTDAQDIEGLWARWLPSRTDQAARNGLVEHFMPVAERFGLRFAKDHPALRDDFTSEAWVALVGAVDTWDPERGFGWVAYLWCRVKFGCIEILRRGGFAPKGLRQEAKRYHEALDALTLAYGRRPTEAEIAEELELPDVDSLHRMTSKLFQTPWDIGSLDEPTHAKGRETSPLRDLVMDQETRTPEQEALMRERLETLDDILERLPAREAQLLRWRFLQGRKSNWIARQMGVHDSRASQLEDVALERARKLARQPRLELELEDDHETENCAPAFCR